MSTPWKRGDELNAKNLNRKVPTSLQGIVFSKSSGGEKINKSPDLIFRQENGSFPADGDQFPIFYARRSFRIIGVIGFSSAGTWTVTLNTDTQHSPDTDLITYSDTDSIGDPPEKYITPDKDGFVGKGDKVILKVDSGSDVEEFQLNVILRVLS